jgi:hypothetical protein
MLGMSEQKKPNVGIKVSQSPGGRSSFQFNWKEPPLAKTINQAVFLLSPRNLKIETE